VLAKQLGLEDVYLLRNRADPVTDTFEAAYRWAASRLGVRIAGASEFSSAERYDAVADRVARSGAEGVMVYDNVHDGGDRLLEALRARLRRATIMVGEGFGEIPDVIELAGPAARGLYVTVPVLPPAGLEPTPALRRFVRDFGDVAHDAYAVHAAQAAEAVLAAIARSDGTRASVLEEVDELRIEDGVLGSFSFDRDGDMAPPKVAVLRVARDTPAGVRLPSRYQGAVVDRVVTVPASLTK
jgi:branched-chain amino acid transport system substrate-binding protein